MSVPPVAAGPTYASVAPSPASVGPRDDARREADAWVGRRRETRTRHGLEEAELADFHRRGYTLRRGLFESEEIARVNHLVDTDPLISKAVYGLSDSGGALTELALWHHLSEDVFGALARSARIVDNAEAMLGGEACFYHSKLTLKRPKVGGAWDWHQDYGYWYRAGYLLPHMLSVFVALDPSTRENGCLQVLEGSHELGRIEHGVVAEQVGADPARLEQARARFPLVHCEMEPGDVLFFHANLLHGSGPNLSEKSRNVLISAYNRVDNAPFIERENNGHTPIEETLDDAALAQWLERPLDPSRRFDNAAV